MVDALGLELISVYGKVFAGPVTLKEISFPQVGKLIQNLKILKADC